MDGPLVHAIIVFKFLAVAKKIHSHWRTILQTAEVTNNPRDKFV